MKQRMKHAAQTVKQVERADRQAQALQMHAAGSTYREIGAALQCSAATVGRLITSAIREAPSVAVRDYRSIVLERVDQVHEANAANAHIPAHANVLLRAAEVLARVEGLFWQPERPFSGTAINVVVEPAPAARRDADPAAVARQAGRR